MATYTAETNCLIIDNSDSQASRFCDINEVHIFNPLEKEDIEVESIRKAIIGQHGGWFTMSFGEFDTDLRDVFKFENVDDLLNRKIVSGRDFCYACET